jgi:nucleoside-diphosphate-sugar epimerase
MRVLVTGHRGYIGAHLVQLLREHGHYVRGLDLGLFDDCGWGPRTPAHEEVTADVRTVPAGVLDGIECVMHLAAISNDPMGDLDPGLTLSVNRDATLRLAGLAKQAGVARFLFASSCSIYGRAAGRPLDEEAEFNPVSVYAQSKIEAELGLRELADARFLPIMLRNATAFGDSPMLRIDLVANNLLGCAIARGEIRIMSDGSPWRPLVHARDIARAFVFFLDAPAPACEALAFNIGADAENYQVRDVADLVQQLVPGAAVLYTGEVGQDPRDYRVAFGRLSRAFPDFRLAYTLQSGLAELNASYRAHGFGPADFDGPRFVRLRTLRGRLSRLEQ